GTVVRYRDIEILALSDELDPGELDLEELDDADEESGDDALELSELPEVRGHLGEMIARHYADWEMQELDVFGGGRPIDVMQRTNGPEKVAAVIEEMERHARDGGPEGTVEALARLRERLGLVRR
ncbi:MAG TPA: hypothetical protein VFL84_02815, partial [Gammaproteobacteria bacterium]|nr:hypothetical protein [Gammaproteobacteria bacterium]